MEGGKRLFSISFNNLEHDREGRCERKRGKGNILSYPKEKLEPSFQRRVSVLIEKVKGRMAQIKYSPGKRKKTERRSEKRL